MATYLICYDINKEGEAYRQANKLLTDRIKELFQTWWHHLDSTWIVVTNLSAAEIRNALRSYIDTDDELLVIKSARDAAWHGFSDQGSSWLKDYL
jgi:CRISPR/Cas system-associated endoribonuclease Cas2